MKKKFIAGLAILLIATSVTFANGQKESSNSTTKDVSAKQTITYWNIGPENPDKKYYTYTVDKFNKNTNSNFVIQQVPIQNDSYKQKIIVAMSSGQCPDMYSSWSGGPMNEYIESGFAQPLDNLVSSSGLKNIIMPAALAQGTYKGHIYGIPMQNLSISGIFYNKEIFKKYGLQVPTTLAELENVCDTLVANGITPFALANKSKWTGSMFFQNLAARKGGLKPFQDAAAGTGSFEDPCFLYAGQKIEEWVKKGYFPEGVNSLSEDDGQGRQLLYQEKAAMDLIGSWYTANLSNDSEEFYKKVGWFSFPAIKGVNPDYATIQIGTIGDQFVSFNCTGDKLKAAFDFITNFTTDENSVKLLVSQGKIPVVKNAGKYITDSVNKEIFNASTKASEVQLWYDQYLSPSVAQVHLNTCQEMFGLIITPEEACSELQAASVAALKAQAN
ncbi:MAG: extracellular solute-binding protein [Peptostreptococcaceae bacterium]|nr:extracellular solute-binding protein [Peptostreptococcaceae bacterium]